MHIHVDCQPGHRDEPTPHRFDLGGRPRDVLEVIDRWYGKDHRYFKVRSADGVYILRHDEPTNVWELILFTQGQS